MEPYRAWDFNSIVNDFLQRGVVYETLFSDIVTSLELEAGMTLDDLGTGTGQVIERLPSDILVRGIDLSDIGVKRAREKFHDRKNVSFHMLNFYTELERLREDYKPDRITACKSLYSAELGRSLDIVVEHLADKGRAIIVHPKPNIVEYFFPKVQGHRTFSWRQIIKASGRLTHPFDEHYHLFDGNEFQKEGEKRFPNVQVGETGKGTHYFVVLNK